jgi:hypothetical protein
MAAINTNISTSFLKFKFTDEDGDVLASFRVNPLDVKLAKRMEESLPYFSNLENNADEATSLDDVAAKNDELEEKICYILGYDARDSLFGQISATSVMGDGSLFVSVLLEKLYEAIGPEIDRRHKSMSAAVEKHTAKYTK